MDYDPRSPADVGRKSVDLSVDAELVAAAKRAGTNMSALLEEALRARLKEEREWQWQNANREAIEQHNKSVEEHGLWSDKYRTW